MTHTRKSGGWIAVRLFALALLLGAAAPALAEDCVADLGGVVDGFVDPVPPSQIKIDGNCTIKNFPASNPLTTNFSFLTQPGQTDERWLVIFDNVVHTGQMACNSVAGHKIWFVNGSSSSIQQGCQNLLIPVEKINKQNPTGQTTASIGVPFTYKLIIPVLFDPATGNVINSAGSPNDLHSVVVTDDLNATGAVLSYVSHVAYWQDDGTPVSHTFSNSGGLLTFTISPIIPAGRQIVIELTVVLEDTPANAPGTPFINTAKWEFGRLIDGVFYQPLPGESGVTPPMTIGAPALVVTKAGPATMNRGESGQFTLDVLNNGNSDAWDVTVLDRLPDGPAGGMCDQTPDIVGVALAGNALSQGSGYSINYAGPPTCALTLNLLDAAGPIGANQHLLITYRTKLDTNSQNGATLTNVAGATRWYNGGSDVTDRQTYNRPLTNGTVGTVDYQDAHTVTVALAGYFFEKTVVDLTTGENPATQAAPGDTLRYTLRLQTINAAINNFTIHDELDALNNPAAFAAGTLALVSSLPAGAVNTSSVTGGAKGTGVINISNLNLAAGGQLQIQFDIKLAPIGTAGTVVANQAQVLTGGTSFAVSDDPNINGQADPNVAGDEDTTRVVIIATAPTFRIQKTAQDLTGDPAVLMAGDMLRYVITVKNVGTENAVNVRLRDLIPANTAYVANSTTLNGSAVADPAAGVSPLQNGMLIHAPEDATPGAMRADASATTANVATVTFTVRIDPSVVNGTIISNQGFVNASGLGSGPMSEMPSDDPATPELNDPTRSVVGNLPLVYTHKTVALQVDNGSPGIVDPADVLRYTLTVTNSRTTPATDVVLRDAVPANTTYVANSATLNGVSVGQPDGGISPLVAGISVNSSGAGGGALSAGGTAVVTIDVRVNAGVATGTIISNQGTVNTRELPPQLTDADGIPANGYQPTLVVVGDAQQLTITKEVSVVGGGAAIAGARLEYVVRITNVSTVPATNVVVTDDLSPLGSNPYVAGSGTLDGLTNGVSYAAPVLTANYSAQYGDLPPGGTTVLRFRANIGSGAVTGATITNTAVVTWNTPSQNASGSVSVSVGGVPGSATLNGRVWHDANFSKTFDSGEQPPRDWQVALYRGSTLLASTVTDANGVYRFSGVTPNDTSSVRYELRFAAPGAGANTATLGRADSAFTNGMQRISDIVAASGANIGNLNLPLQPNGVVYDSVGRSPVAGAALTLVQASTQAPLPRGCFDDPAQQGQVTLSGGYYKFDLNFSDAACPPGGDYLIAVSAPATFAPAPSQVIPPASGGTTAAFSVPNCPGSASDAVVTTNYCEAQGSGSAPAASVPPRTAGTRYYLRLILNNAAVPQSSQIFNNHIPIDPLLGDAVAITKTAGMVNVTRGQLVPYTITVRNTSPTTLADLSLADTMPPGFKYVERSSRFDGNKVEPIRNGRQLSWPNLTLIPNDEHVIKLLLVVGAGVGEGDYVNRAQVFSALTAGSVSGEASATVRVVPDPTFDCTDIIGKVFDDANLNGRQDKGESGLQGVRIVSARGLIMTTDQYGRFHLTCAVVPDENRGSNFVLKLDERSLPSGYRLTTGNPLVERATRGKMIKFNFGAALHRVVSLGLADAVFEPDSTEMRPQWQPRIETLLAEIKEAPSILRITYLADLEDEALVRSRIERVEAEVKRRWEEGECCRRLTIETEVFWRRGAPVEGQPPDRDPGSAVTKQPRE